MELAFARLKASGILQDIERELMSVCHAQQAASSFLLALSYSVHSSAAKATSDTRANH
jgi:hypothetical protein